MYNGIKFPLPYSLIQAAIGGHLARLQAGGGPGAEGDPAGNPSEFGSPLPTPTPPPPPPPLQLPTGEDELDAGLVPPNIKVGTNLSDASLQLQRAIEFYNKAVFKFKIPERLRKLLSSDVVDDDGEIKLTGGISTKFKQALKVKEELRNIQKRRDEELQKRRDAAQKKSKELREQILAKQQARKDAKAKAKAAEVGAEIDAAAPAEGSATKQTTAPLTPKDLDPDLFKKLIAVEEQGQKEETKISEEERRVVREEQQERAVLDNIIKTSKVNDAQIVAATTESNTNPVFHKNFTEAAEALTDLHQDKIAGPTDLRPEVRAEDRAAAQALGDTEFQTLFKREFPDIPPGGSEFTGLLPDFPSDGLGSQPNEDSTQFAERGILDLFETKVQDPTGPDPFQPTLTEREIREALEIQKDVNTFFDVQDLAQTESALSQTLAQKEAAQALGDVETDVGNLGKKRDLAFEKISQAEGAVDKALATLEAAKNGLLPSGHPNVLEAFITVDDAVQSQTLAGTRQGLAAAQFIKDITPQQRESVSKFIRDKVGSKNPVGETFKNVGDPPGLIKQARDDLRNIGLTADDKKKFDAIRAKNPNAVPTVEQAIKGFLSGNTARLVNEAEAAKKRINADKLAGKTPNPKDLDAVFKGTGTALTRTVADTASKILKFIPLANTPIAIADTVARMAAGDPGAILSGLSVIPGLNVPATVVQAFTDAVNLTGPNRISPGQVASNLASNIGAGRTAILDPSRPQGSARDLPVGITSRRNQIVGPPLQSSQTSPAPLPTPPSTTPTTPTTFNKIIGGRSLPPPPPPSISSGINITSAAPLKLGPRNLSLNFPQPGVNQFINPGLGSVTNLPLQLTTPTTTPGSTSTQQASQVAQGFAQSPIGNQVVSRATSPTSTGTINPATAQSSPTSGTLGSISGPALAERGGLIQYLMRKHPNHPLLRKV